MVPMQILMDMMIDQNYWFNQKIIYVKKGLVLEILLELMVNTLL